MDHYVIQNRTSKEFIIDDNGNPYYTKELKQATLFDGAMRANKYVGKHFTDDDEGDFDRHMVDVIWIATLEGR